MKITAGKNKGKKLIEFELSTTRPTSDLVKQAMFNIIEDKINQCVFLDLFSGTGAISCEAVSRGAKIVYAIDCNNESINIISKNKSLINATNMFVEKNSYDLFLFKHITDKFDIVFLDPPYKTDLAEQAIKIIFENNLLAEDGILIWEHDESKLKYVENFVNAKTKRYGKKYLTILKNE